MIEEILLLIITVLLIALCLFFADKIIGDKPDSLGGGYLLKAIITAIIIIVLIIVAGVITGLVPPFAQLSTVLGFVLACYAIKSLLLKRSSYEKAVWVGVVTYALVYLIDWLARLISHRDLIQYI